jgi:D-erythritol 1-phosphate dehydrogenase
MRPAWLVRLGLFFYDHLGGRKFLPPTRALDLRRDPEGRALKPEYRNAFEYSDCWVDDARLVVHNALAARARGAEILTRTALASARREGAVWRVELEDRRDGSRRSVRAKGIVNAAGPWVEQVLGRVLGVNSSRRVRLVKGSHLVTRKFWDGDHAYLLQNSDKRVIFVNPYEGDLALIGTTDIPVEGRPEDAAIDQAETAYLLGVLARYFRDPPGEADIVYSFSGVRPIYDDSAANPSAVTRDYAFDIEPRQPDADRAPLLSVFGGKITTYRRLAEHTLDRLAPFYPKLGPAWTASTPMPGGDMPGADFQRWLAGFRASRPWLPPGLALHYGRLYGTRADALLGDARGLGDLGRHFGAALYAREASFLLREEWAETAEDILSRRTKHGLHIGAAEAADFGDWLKAEDSRPRPVHA